MKTVTMIIIFSIIMLLSCKDENSNENTDNGYNVSEGLIYDYDITLCMCCGGWKIDINGDSLRIFKSIPALDSTISKMQLPVKVRVGWKRFTEGSCGARRTNLIEINSFEIQ